MKRVTLNATLGVLLAASGTLACNSFLTGPKLTENPNAPTSATRDQLFLSVQASQFIQLEGALVRTACMWMQQCVGVDRQYLTLGTYQTVEDDFSGEFSGVYTGGGLLDIRKIEASAEASGDQVYAAIAKVWEAYVMGTAADVWGNIPYSEAGTDVQYPHLDPQSQVYATVQAKLDTALTELGGTGAGPGALDLVYGGNKSKWTEAAHTLKARFHLHMAEVDNSRYAQALAEASQGISISANDFKSYHSSLTSENNIWYQFQVIQRDSYMRVGKRLVDIMVGRNDPRLPVYFSKNTSGGYGGKDPGETADNTTSNICCTGVTGSRLDPAFRQPLITWAENQLIVAEASYQTGAEPAALTALNTERTAAGLSALSGITGAALLDSIMTEKYVVTFQNIESWSDYRRTCLPALVPASGHTEIPGRFFYGFSERNTNPNIPNTAEQLATNGGRNPNDPNPCP